MIKYFRNHTESIVGILILFVVCSVYFYGLSNVTKNYHPVWNDEHFYYINANAYFQNNTLAAALTLNGKGSIIFKCDPHGFAYPLLHGSFAKLIGWHSSNFILFNFLLIALSIVLIFYLLPVSLNKKIYIIAIFLLFPFIPLYAFTYMQELIQVFFAVLLGVLLYHISEEKNNKKLIVIFVLAIVVASLFRGSWFFWLIGLLPFANNKRELLYFFILFILGFFASIAFVNLFGEAVPNYFSQMIALLLDGKIYEVAHSLFMHTLNNVKLYLFSTNSSLVYFSMKFLTAGVIGFFSYHAIKTKDKMSISIVLMGLVNFILVFIFYDANYWREIRTLSPLFYFSILFLVLKLDNKSNYILIAALTALFTLTFKISLQQIKERNDIANYSQLEHDAFRLIAESVSKDEIILINNIPIEHSWLMLYLPLQNKYKQPIRYMIPFYGLQFKGYNYSLTPKGYQTKGTKILNTPFYCLSKNDVP